MLSLRRDKATKLEQYRERVKKGLNRSFEAARKEARPFDAERESLVVFSDHHRGTRDGADDFWRCERSYHAALGYYLETDYRLVLLGDVEELWENRPRDALAAYAQTLELEGEFHANGRLDRLWGNHDDLWRHERKVRSRLGKYIQDLPVRDGMVLEVRSGAKPLGLLFLVHGHQGTLDGDRYRIVSRLFVRYVWRPLQRRLKFTLNTPARDFDLRANHDQAMFQWALNRPENVVLIAGHTHHPIFSTPDKRVERTAAEVEAHLARRRAALEKALTEAEEHDDAGHDVEPSIAELRAELELVKTKPYGEPPKEMPLPCYFNTGCCSFGDGDVTGLELAEGQIRLIRWLNDDYQPRKKDLAPARSLADVFAAVERASSVSAP